MKLFLFFFAASFLGCSGAQKSKTPVWEEGIYDLRTGTRIERSELEAAVQRAKVVIVGESHDSAKDHARQLDIIRWANDGALVGMEMFQRPFQEPLDRFIAGDIDEKEMLLQTEWEKRWGFETELYRPIWEEARERKFSIIALNLRRELTKKISKGGISSLTEAERSELPEHDLTNDAYRSWLREVFSSHGTIMEDAKFERFCQAQVMWDETMANSAVDALGRRQAAQIIMIVGRGHVERDWGIPSRVRRRLSVEYPEVITIIPSRGELPKMESLRRESFADFVWITR